MTLLSVRLARAHGLSFLLPSQYFPYMVTVVRMTFSSRSFGNPHLVRFPEP